jgi:hypothetical protein
MDQDKLDPLEPIEPRDGPVESQDDDDGWADDSVETEPGAAKKCIYTRPQLKRAGAVVILSLMRQGLIVTHTDVVELPASKIRSRLVVKESDLVAYISDLPSVS